MEKERSLRRTSSSKWIGCVQVSEEPWVWPIDGRPCPVLSHGWEHHAVAHAKRRSLWVLSTCDDKNSEVEQKEDCKLRALYHLMGVPASATVSERGTDRDTE